MRPFSSEFVTEEERKGKEALGIKFEETDPAVVFQANLTKLHDNLSKECAMLYSHLKDLYFADPVNEIVRKSLHLSIVGTIWTEALKILPSIISVPSVFELKDAPDIWAEINTQAKAEIINRIREYTSQTQTSEENNITTEDLWIFIFKELEAAVHKSRKYRKMFQCFYNQNTSKRCASIRKRYCTDLVLSPGPFGLPLLMVEIAEGDGSEGIHKDTTKLAFQMGEVLFHLIGALRKKRRNEEDMDFIPNLCVFGALISGTQIQLCISRPHVSYDGKFTIIFETKIVDQEWTFDLCMSKLLSTSKSESPLCINMTEFGQSKDLISVFTSLNIDEAKSANRAVNVANKTESKIDVVNLDAIVSLTKFIDFVHCYYKRLPGLIAYIYSDSGVTDDNFLYSPVLPVGKYPPEEARSIDSSPFDIAPIDAPTQYIFPTLPNVRFTKPFEPEPTLFRCDQYIEEYNLTQLERWFENEYAKTDKLSINKSLFRAHFIVGISMALYKALQAGYIFETFEFDDITFRDHSFCIKTYHHVISTTNPSSTTTLADSFKAFSALYYAFWFYDTYMTEGDAEYDALRRLEWCSFGKMKEADGNYFDWSDYFTELLEKYENMDAEELSRSPETLFLLKHMMKTDNLYKYKHK